MLAHLNERDEINYLVAPDLGEAGLEWTRREGETAEQLDNRAARDLPAYRNRPAPAGLLPCVEALHAHAPPRPRIVSGGGTRRDGHVLGRGGRGKIKAHAE